MDKRSLDAMTSSKSNEWCTPKSLFDSLNKEFHFTLDAAASDENHKCDKYYTIHTNGLIHSWKGETVFINPPYGGHVGKWVKKAYDESLDGATVVMLISSSTDRSYWHNYIFPYAKQIRFVRGRIRFSNHVSSAPFASAIVVFGNKEYDERFVWSDVSACKLYYSPRLINYLPKEKPIEHGWF